MASDQPVSQVGYRAFVVDIQPGQRDELIRFHAEQADSLNELFGANAQVRRASRFVTPDNRMLEYFEYDGELATFRAAMRLTSAFGAEEQMVERCWRFPQTILDRIFHYEAP